MKDVIRQSWLVFPLSGAAGSGPERARLLLNRLNTPALEKLFLKAFLKALKKQDKEFRPLLWGIKRIVKKNKDELLDLFNAGAEHSSEFFIGIETGEFHQKMAETIVWELSLDVNLVPVMVIIVRDALEMYKEAFLETANKRAGERKKAEK